jgi:MFS family permease
VSTHERTVGEPLRLLGFRTFWVASTLGFFGLSVTTLAVDVLVIRGLDATEVEVGVIRAAQFAPYLLIGLIAGALVDRWRRRPTLVITNLAQGLLLLLVPMLWWFDALTVWVVAGVLLITGSFAVFAAAAEQSFLPDLVPRHSLVMANARLGQSMTVAQSVAAAGRSAHCLAQRRIRPGPGRPDSCGHSGAGQPDPGRGASTRGPSAPDAAQ